MKFYVYLLRDPRPGKDLQPIYVGKGKGSRAHMHWRRAEEHPNLILRRVFDKIRQAGLVPQLEIVARFDTEADAFQLEIELIVKYGRRDLKTGTLCNLTDGGEGASGCLAAAEFLRKLHLNPEFAKVHADRAREHLRKLWTDFEFLKAHTKRMKALHADPKFAKANSESMRKLHADPEFARNRDECLKKRNANPEFAKASVERMHKLNADPEFAKATAERMKNLNADPAFAQARDERVRKQWADPESRVRMSAGMVAAWTDPEARTQRSAAMVVGWAKRRAAKAIRTCSVPDCSRPHKSKGFCSMHVQRFDKDGKVGEALPTRAKKGSGNINTDGLSMQYTGVGP